MKNIEYKDLPSSWAFCFNEQCSKKETCIKYLTTNLIPADVKIGRVVLPTTYADAPCELYHEKRTMTVAWGFDNLFYDVKKRDIKPIRQELFDLLDSRTSYYRYASGEKRLTPTQQQAVLTIFQSHGYPTTSLHFDHYEEVWDV